MNGNSRMSAQVISQSHSQNDIKAKEYQINNVPKYTDIFPKAAINRSNSTRAPLKLNLRIKDRMGDLYPRNKLVI
jgi:hypothetical protein